MLLLIVYAEGRKKEFDFSFLRSNYIVLFINNRKEKIVRMFERFFLFLVLSYFVDTTSISRAVIVTV